MILDDIFSVEEEKPDPLDEILSSSDETEDLYLPESTYNLIYIPQSHHLQSPPFATPHVRFADYPDNNEGWIVDIDRPTFTFFSMELRPPTPPIHAYTSNALGGEEHEVLLAHNSSPLEKLSSSPYNHRDSTGCTNLRSHYTLKTWKKATYRKTGRLPTPKKTCLYIAHKT